MNCRAMVKVRRVELTNLETNGQQKVDTNVNATHMASQTVTYSIMMIINNDSFLSGKSFETFFFM